MNDRFKSLLLVMTKINNGDLDGTVFTCNGTHTLRGCSSSDLKALHILESQNELNIGVLTLILYEINNDEIVDISSSMINYKNADFFEESIKIANEEIKFKINELKEKLNRNDFIIDKFENFKELNNKNLNKVIEVKHSKLYNSLL